MDGTATASTERIPTEKHGDLPASEAAQLSLPGLRAECLSISIISVYVYICIYIYIHTHSLSLSNKGLTGDMLSIWTAVKSGLEWSPTAGQLFPKKVHAFMSCVVPYPNSQTESCAPLVSACP